MSSLFRIDKNSVIAQDSKTAGFVVLPRLEDMINKSEKDVQQEKEEEEPVPEAGDNIDEELEIKKRQLENLQAKIEEAGMNAKSIIDQAKLEAEGLYEKAAREGFKAGIGRAQEEVAHARRQEKQAFENALQSLSAAKDALYNEMEAGVLDLALYISRHIIKTELQGNDEAYKNIVRNLISTLKNQTSILLKTSKEEYERFFADPASDLLAELNNSGIRVVQDMSLGSGDCMVETEYGCMNAGIKTQLNRLEYALKQIGAEI